MRDLPSKFGSTEKFYLFMGAIAGALFAFAILRQFSPIPAVLISAIAFALLSFSSTQIIRPTLWWTGTGALGGLIIGLAVVLEGVFAAEKENLPFRVRLIFLLLQGISGFLSGAILGRKLHRAHVPTLKEFLARASLITGSLFALVVTASFLREGIEVARALASRLSTTTTVVVTALAIPGIAGYLLFEVKGSRNSNN
jgi:hypothetical protein